MIDGKFEGMITWEIENYVFVMNVDSRNKKVEAIGG